MLRGNLKGRIAGNWELVDCRDWKAGSIRNYCNFPLWKLVNEFCLTSWVKGTSGSSRRMCVAPGAANTEAHSGSLSDLFCPMPTLPCHLSSKCSSRLACIAAAVSSFSIHTHSFLLAVATCPLSETKGSSGYLLLKALEQLLSTMYHLHALARNKQNQ